MLKGVNLQIRRGEFVAVLGHNGSGKSTLAKHLNAILQPTSGKVLVEGMDTSDPELLFDIRQHVGMVFQNPDNQIVATIVEEDVAFAPENLGVPREEMRKRVDDALKAVHMYEYRHHAPHQLSGGQKQRVAIAGIIAMRPEHLPGGIVQQHPAAVHHHHPVTFRRFLHIVGDQHNGDAVFPVQAPDGAHDLPPAVGRPGAAV